MRASARSRGFNTLSTPFHARSQRLWDWSAFPSECSLFRPANSAALAAADPLGLSCASSRRGSSLASFVKALQVRSHRSEVWEVVVCLLSYLVLVSI